MKKLSKGKNAKKRYIWKRFLFATGWAGERYNKPTEYSEVYTVDVLLSHQLSVTLALFFLPFNLVFCRFVLFTSNHLMAKVLAVYAANANTLRTDATSLLNKVLAISQSLFSLSPLHSSRPASPPSSAPPELKAVTFTQCQTLAKQNEIPKELRTREITFAK